MSRKILKGDLVKVIAGADKNLTGKVINVNYKKKTITVSGINIVTRHVKARQGVRQVGLVKKEMPVSISNVLYVDEASGKFGRVGWRFLEDNTKERFIRSVE